MAEHELSQVEDELRQRKELLWQQLQQEFLQLADGLGKGIDDGILNTVIGLNALGITTRQSCEGHIEWGTGAPWVDIIDLDPEVEALATSAGQAWEAVEKAEAENTPEEELDRLFEEAHQARREAEKKRLEISQKVMNLLTTFYADRQVSYDRQLVLAFAGQRIESIGAMFQDTVDLSTKQEKLLEYQQEMQAFTEYLRGAFFAEATPPDAAEKILATLKQQREQLN